MILALILIPLIGAALVAGLPPVLSRVASLAVTALAALIVALIGMRFDPSDGGLQLVQQYDWIPAIGAQFFFAVDGLSMLVVILTALIVPFAFLAGRGQDRGYCVLMLITQSALFGTFTAQNFVLWFLFYEMSLIPAFLLIKLWGEGVDRDRAATTFFVYTFLGSVAMLAAMLGVYFTTGTFDSSAATFDFPDFAQVGQDGLLTGSLGWVLFAGVFLGLAVKIPIFPFHTWLPDAYAAAPTGTAMVLTGLLSKMGVYGAIRLLLPLFPQHLQALQPWLLGLVVCSIVLSALAAWAQTDLKRMVAYLSINHLGYCMLGLFAVAGTVSPSGPDVQAALAGVFMQIFNHGLTAAALFYYVGLLEERRGSRHLDDFGGLMQRAPQFVAFLSIAMFSSLGLPGLNGFIGEILIFRGSFALVPIATALSSLGLLFTAVVFLRAMQKLFSGPLPESCSDFPDLHTREKLVVVPATLLMLALGLAPQFMFTVFNATVAAMSRLFVP